MCIEQLGASDAVSRLVDLSGDGVVLVDETRHVTWANARAGELFRRTREELMGQDVGVLLAPDGGGCPSAMVYCEADPFEWDGECLAADGARIPARVRTARLPGYAGRALLLQDLSEQQGLDSLVRRLRGESYLKRNRLRSFLSVLPVGVWLLEEDGTVIEANEVAQQLWGGVPDDGSQLPGKARVWWHGTGEPVSEVAWCGYRALRLGESVRDELLDVTCFDGSRRTLLHAAVPLQGTDGGIRGAVVLHQDVTVLVDQQRRLERFTQDLERSNKELEQFAGVVSHDLKEPLRMVQIYLDIFDKRYGLDLPDEGRDFIRYAQQGADRAQRLIRALLRWARSGRRLVQTRTVDMQLVVTDVLADLAHVIQVEGARVRHEPLPSVLGDPDLLSHLLQNLVCNAIKFRGECDPRVEVAVHRDQGMWHFEVRDNGRGIDPADHERIFEMFTRAADDTPGDGIGLATCRRIAASHGGDLWLQRSAPGEGSTFAFTLPAAPRL